MRRRATLLLALLLALTSVAAPSWAIPHRGTTPPITVQIAGVPYPGNTLTPAAPLAPGSTCQWLLNGSPISGATSCSGYVVQSGDDAGTITLQVTPPGASAFYAPYNLNFAAGSYSENGVSYALTALPGWNYSRNGTAWARNSSGTYVQFAANVPRVTDLGLLIEEAATNVATFSNDQSNAIWSKFHLNVTAAQADPFGTNTAGLYTADGTSNSHNVANNATVSYTAGQVYTLAWIVKPGTATLVQITMGSGAFGFSQYANFQLTGSGSVTASLGATNPTITSLANGWYRVSAGFTATTTTTGQAGALYLIPSGTIARAPIWVSSDTIYVSQLDSTAGSFATSPILTGSSPVTRPADFAYLSGLPLSGPFTVAARAVQSPNATSPRLWRVTDNVAADNNYVEDFGQTNATFQSAVGGTVGLNISGSGNTSTALSWDGTNFVTSSSGVAGTPTAGALPSGMSNLVIGNRSTATTRAWDGFIQSVYLWQTGMTGAQLNAITQ